MKIEFDVFWESYQKKVGLKRKLKTKWDRLTEQDQIKALKHIPLYIESQPDKQYRKNPETYLNNESWNDEIIITSKSTLADTLTSESLQELKKRSKFNYE